MQTVETLFFIISNLELFHRTKFFGKVRACVVSNRFNVFQIVARDRLFGTRQHGGVRVDDFEAAPALFRSLGGADEIHLALSTLAQWLLFYSLPFGFLAFHELLPVLWRHKLFRPQLRQGNVGKGFVRHCHVLRFLEMSALDRGVEQVGLQAVGNNGSTQVVVNSVTTPEEVQEVKVVDWSLRNLWINVSLRELFLDEHGNCDSLYPPASGWPTSPFAIYLLNRPGAPWSRVAGYSTPGPQAHRSCKASHRLFGKIKITERADQSCQDSSRIHAIKGVEQFAYLLG